MKIYSIAAVLVVALYESPASIAAQTPTLEFHAGRISLQVSDVPGAAILAEWARVGGTRIVIGGQLVGTPVTLTLVSVPEREALDLLLREAGGYIASWRRGPVDHRSAYDRILILTTSQTLQTPATDAPDGRTEPSSEEEDAAIADVEARPDEEVGDPLERFLRLVLPSATK